MQEKRSVYILNLCQTKKHHHDHGHSYHHHHLHHHLHHHHHQQQQYHHYPFITLSLELSIQWIMQLASKTIFQWIVIYMVGKALSYLRTTES